MRGMSQYIKILFFTLPLWFLSCSNYLKEDPKSELPHDEVITDAQSLYNNAVSALYNHIGSAENGSGLQGTYRGVYDLQTFTTDEAIIPTRGGDWYDGGLWQDLYLHQFTPDNEVIENAWNYLYKVIALANLSLDIIDQHKDLLDDSQIIYYKAEVRALRAMYYYYLLDLYGNVPIILQTNLSMANIAQSSRKEVFNFVYDELTDCMPYLSPEMSHKQGTFYGHITQPVANFVLMKLMLNSEVWIGSAMYDKAIEYADIISSFGYSLSENQTDCFAVYNEQNNENIFCIPMDKMLYQTKFCNQFRSMHYQHGAAIGYGGENGAAATLEALDAFGYGTQQVDTRFYTTYFADTVFVDDQPLHLSNGDILIYRPKEIKLDLTASKYVATAGARMYKYAIDPTGFSDGKLRDNDIVLFRYADVLLTKAEALVRLGKDGSECLNQIRQRANMPLIDATLDNILDERLRELAWEGWRRQDMIRFSTFFLPYSNRPAMPLEQTHYTQLFPIPQTIIDMNQNIKQNPYY